MQMRCQYAVSQQDVVEVQYDERCRRCAASCHLGPLMSCMMWMDSLSPLPKAMSSASAELWQMVCCVLEAKLSGTSRTLMMYPEVLLRVLMSPAQSLSVYALTWMGIA